MEPLVSILIPAFNAENWLAESLRSAVGQTWNRKEIIVVDDGSTDKTLDVARSFEPHGVKVYSQKNQGAAAARNKAFSLSRGEYIQWLDADDLLGRDKVALQMEALEASSSRKTLVSPEWGRFLHRPERANFKPSGLWRDLTVADWLIRKMVENTYMQTACWLVTREMTEAAGPWDVRLLGDDDGEYFCRVLMASEGVRFVPGARVYYRQSGSASLSHIGVSDRKRDAQWLSMRLHIQYLRSLEDSPRVHTACLTYLQNWMVYFYPERLDLFDQAQELAQSLGGRLEPPKLSWKYSWIDAAFGWRLARQAQRQLPALKWRAISSIDKMVYLATKRSQSECVKL